MPAPLNDNLADATDITATLLTATHAVTTVDATFEAQEEDPPLFFVPNYPSVWLKFQSPVTGPLMAHVESLTPGFNPYVDLLHLNDSSPAYGDFSYTPGEYVGDGTEAPYDAQWELTAGNWYAVYAGSWDEAGEGAMELTFRSVGRPANDLVANAELLTESTVLDGTTEGATDDALPNVLGGSTLSSAVWYRFEALAELATFRVRFEAPARPVDDSGHFAWLFKTTADPATLADFTAVDTFLSEDFTYEINVDPGDHVYLAMASFSQRTADFRLTVLIPSDPLVSASMAGRFYESPPARMIVTNLESETLTWLDKLASERQVLITRGAPRVQRCRVPADNPEVNIPAPAPDDEPFVAEGVRLLYTFFREGGDPKWKVRAGGIILELGDNADEDHATSTVVAYDPWKLLYRHPIRQADGTIAGEGGRSYPADTRANDIIIEQLDLMRTANAGEPLPHCGLDWGWGTGGDGVLEDTEPIPNSGDGTAITFQRASSLGEMFDTLQKTGTIDIVIDPVYDPVARPGIVGELSLLVHQGSYKPNAILAWDRWPRNVVGLTRLIDGFQRANRVQFYAGGGGKLALRAPEQTDTASIARFGSYWLQQMFPGIPSVSVAELLGARLLALDANGAITFSVSLAAERAPRTFLEYREGDTLPLYASKRFRDAIEGLELRVETIPINIGDDNLARITNAIISLEVDAE